MADGQSAPSGPSPTSRAISSLGGARGVKGPHSGSSLLSAQEPRRESSQKPRVRRCRRGTQMQEGEVFADSICAHLRHLRMGSGQHGEAIHPRAAEVGSHLRPKGRMRRVGRVLTRHLLSANSACSAVNHPIFLERNRPSRDPSKVPFVAYIQQKSASGL
jgi:hypothetical protein